MAICMLGTNSVFAGENILLPTLTHVDQVRQLPVDEAARAYPVRLRGVITYRARGHSLFFIQDETGGIYIRPDLLPQSMKNLGAGVEVEVEGCTIAGRFAPSVEGKNGHVLGTKPLPEPVWLSADQLGDARNHSQWVELSGYVRSARIYPGSTDVENETILNIGGSSGRFSAMLYGLEASNPILTNMMGAQVRVRGVYGSMFNDRRQLIGMRLFVNSARDIQIEKIAGADPFTQPPKTISTLMQFEPGPNIPSRVHVQGVVSLVTPEGVYVEDSAAGVKILPISPGRWLSGQQVDVVGFPAWGDWNPILEDAEIRSSAGVVQRAPPLIHAIQALSGDYCYRKVQMEAMVLQSPRYTEQPALILQEVDRLFLARFSLLPKPGLNSFQEGSWVRVTGVCINQARPEPENPAHGSGQNLIQRASLFHLLLASPADVTLLRAPSWWTASRLATLILAFVVVLLGAGFWLLSLRRQVEAKTQIIRQQTARESVYEERERIAREFHDTLEQEITGIGMQLDAAGAMLGPEHKNLRTTIETARLLLERSRKETRHSIWELRSPALEQGGLPAALKEFLLFVEGRQNKVTPEIDFIVEGDSRRLSLKTETHLLRIAGEALANALKHSQARHVAIKLVFRQSEIVLSIKDDGCGFDSDLLSKICPGHYGLLGIKERVAKIQGHLELISSPGHGTHICVTIDQRAERQQQT